MKISTFCVLAAISGLCASVRADDPAIISKARAYLGPESVLDAVTSIHMVGIMISPSVNSAAPEQTAIEFIFQKPEQESMTLTNKTQISHTSLDGFEGAQEAQDGLAANQTSVDLHKPWRLTILSPQQVNALRIDVMEWLWFYHGPLHDGGQIEDRGPATADGIDTEKVAFVYGPKSTYIKQFDRSTGRLVYSESDSGTIIRESGEIMAGGIRFPREITFTEVLNGKESKRTMTFDKVTVNESFPESLFAIPDMPAPQH